MVGAPPTSPTWFAEVGPAPRWVDPGEAWLARQLPARGSRSRQGRSEGSVASPGALQVVGPRFSRLSWSVVESLETTSPYACSVLLRTLLAGLAGVALSLSAPPVGFFWVLPFAVAAYVLLTVDLAPRRAWVPGLAFGVGYCYVLMWWMRAVDVYAWLALAGLEALFYGLLGAAVPLLRRLPAWPVWVAVAWSAMEVLRSGWPFSGMPWGRLAFAVVDTPVAPALAYVGATGVSLLLALAGTLAGRAGDARHPQARRRRGTRRDGRGAAGARPAPLGPDSGRHAPGRVGAGRRPRRRHRRARRLPPGHRQPRPGDRRAGRRGGRGGARAAGLRAVAGELHGRRPVRRRADPHRHRDGGSRRSAYRSWSGPWSTPVPTT